PLAHRHLLSFPTRRSSDLKFSASYIRLQRNNFFGESVNLMGFELKTIKKVLCDLQKTERVQRGNCKPRSLFTCFNLIRFLSDLFLRDVFRPYTLFCGISDFSELPIRHLKKSG